MGKLDFRNTTDLDDQLLCGMCRSVLAGWATGSLTVRIRYSRGADFSGSCYYNDGCIYVNLGRHVRYPYAMGTHIARGRTVRGYWVKPIYTVELADGYQLALFVFLHELYHLLVKRARRNLRQKESMCDRFATRYLVDHCGAVVRDERRREVPRSAWDFQDVEGFVAAARDKRLRQVPPVALPVLMSARTPQLGEQLLLF